VSYATTQAPGAIPVQRGCGTRTKGSIYLEMGLGDDGVPVEWYLIDPSGYIPEGLDINPRGVAPHVDEKTGVAHIIDWIGKEFYPYTTDFIEEVRCFGMSRKIAPSFPFEILTPRSRHLCVHPRAIIKNWRDLAASTQYATYCPKQSFRLTYHEGDTKEQYRPMHHFYPAAPPPPTGHPRADANGMCAGYWWRSLVEDEHPMSAVSDHNPLSVLREMPSFKYIASMCPPTFTPEWEPGFFMRMPLTRIVVIDDPTDPELVNRHLQAISRSALPVALVGE
jgi:hypothetical protein